MKKYQKLFLLSGAVLGLFASHSTVQAVASTEAGNKVLGPTDRASNVTVNVTGDTAQIHYARSKAQVPYTISHAVWSDENGQDDLKWYTTPQTSSTAIDLRQHAGYGTFHVHTYININGKMIGLSLTTFTVNKPSSKTSVTTSGQIGRINFTRNKDQINSRILHAVWSDENGQDDLKWYNAGQDITEFALSNHKGYGTYHVHTYENKNGKMIALNGATFQLEKPNPTIQTSFPEPGIMEILIKNLPESMYKVNVPTWSENKGQDDIKWYTANKVGNGLYKFTINTQQHAGNGVFHTHVYRNLNGQMTGLTGTSYQVDKPTTPEPTLYTPDYAGASSYPVGQCTWGAKVLAPWAGPYWGNGGQWAASARAAGFRTGSTPQVGAIICWTDGGYGHVGVVTHVESNTRIQIKESNYAGKQYIGNFRGWFNPYAAGQGAVSYIYPK